MAGYEDYLAGSTYSDDYVFSASGGGSTSWDVPTIPVIGGIIDWFKEEKTSPNEFLVEKIPFLKETSLPWYPTQKKIAEDLTDKTLIALKPAVDVATAFYPALKPAKTVVSKATTAAKAAKKVVSTSGTVKKAATVKTTTKAKKKKGSAALKKAKKAQKKAEAALKKALKKLAKGR